MRVDVQATALFHSLFSESPTAESKWHLILSTQPNCFAADRYASFSSKVFHIPVAQVEATVEPDDSCS